MIRRRSTGFLTLAFAAATVLLVEADLQVGLFSRALAQAPAKTTADGVYTAAQAERGGETYGRYCARCHGADLDGIGAAPMLYSSRFLDRYREDALRTLYDYIATNMPQDGTPGPGKLTPAQYLDITAFLLNSSELPAGNTELKAEDLDTTTLVGPGGPQPLPPAATVRVVGCLTQAGGAWTVTQASTPARAQKGDTTTPAEIERSNATAAGALTYRLPNLGDDHSAAELGAQAGKRVQIKGVLNGEGAAARISVLSFTPLGQACK